MKMAVFWDVLCGLADINQHFRGAGVSVIPEDRHL
jgi:hypothetical protein